MRARGLSDLRTATTSRIHAKPPQKGTEYLNLYLLDKESQRLEQELAGLDHRQKRIQTHLAEIHKAMTKVGEDAQQEHPTLLQTPAGNTCAGRDYRQRQWKKMPVDY
ncbi:MAG: hypothetical protein Q8P59_07685 [Dehalococcoidia bacterium]|nr:hypothetical protein [Dehalococcoidia bacterium]